MLVRLIHPPSSPPFGQIAAGVPFKIGEHPSTKTFRIGLFGLDKLVDPAATVAHFERALDVAVPRAAAPAAAAAAAA
jgi:aspartate aminotransferase-like enzyme